MGDILRLARRECDIKAEQSRRKDKDTQTEFLSETLRVWVAGSGERYHTKNSCPYMSQVNMRYVRHFSKCTSCAHSD